MRVQPWALWWRRAKKSWTGACLPIHKMGNSRWEAAALGEACGAQQSFLHKHNEPVRFHFLLRIPGYYFWGDAKWTYCECLPLPSTRPFSLYRGRGVPSTPVTGLKPSFFLLCGKPCPFRHADIVKFSNQSSWRSFEDFTDAILLRYLEWLMCQTEDSLKFEFELYTITWFELLGQFSALSLLWVYANE